MTKLEYMTLAESFRGRLAKLMSEVEQVIKEAREQGIAVGLAHVIEPANKEDING